MALYDLYSPRIAEEGRESRFKRELLTGTLGDAAKALFAYSINKQELDSAYAEIEAKADAERRKSYWDDKLKSNELNTKRYNAAKIGLSQNPDDPAAWQVLSDAMFDYSGVRPDPARKKDIIDDLTFLTIDEKTGGYTPQAQQIVADLNKPHSDTGKLLGDMQKLRESGVAEDSPDMIAYRNQLAKNAAIEIGSWAGTHLSTLPPDAAVAQYERWIQMKARAGGTNITLKQPAEGERAAFVDWLVLNKKLEILRGKWNKIQSKYANVFNTPTGIGAESIQNIMQRAGAGEPDIADFQKTVNDFQNNYLNIISGKVITGNEAVRLIGNMVSGGSLISSTQDAVTFGKVLDLNHNNVIQRLQIMKDVSSDVDVKVPDIPPPPPGAMEGDTSRAAPENATGTGPRDTEANQATKDAAERKRIQDNLRDRRKARERGEKPPPIEPHSMMFNRSLERG